MKLESKKIAVVGAGAAGLAASYLLSSRHEVTLFESSGSLGGHAHAETLEDEFGKPFSVDTAFLIFNERTYPCFMKFIECLGVSEHAVKAEMSSCFSDPEQGFSYALGGGWRPLLRRPANFTQTKLARILFDLFLFRKMASEDLRLGKDLSGVTLDEYLKKFSGLFIENFVLPLTAAIWSLPAADMRKYPILPILRYFDNHRLLKGASDKKWRTFSGSSRVYTEAFTRSFRGTIRLNSKVQSIIRTPAGVSVVLPMGLEHFDHVVLATHADVSLRLLANPTESERNLLGEWRYKDNLVTLHTDISVLHHDSALWSSWNMSKKNGDYSISYYLNRLQGLKTQRPVVLTLGVVEPNGHDLNRQFNYRHPIFDEASVATQEKLSSLNGVDRVSYCGSYFGFGFHEDAVRSATQVASQFAIGWDDLLKSRVGA